MRFKVVAPVFCLLHHLLVQSQIFWVNPSAKSSGGQRPVKFIDPCKLICPSDFVRCHAPEIGPYPTEVLALRKECFATPQCVLCSLSFADVTDNASKYFVTVSRQLAE